MNWNEVVRYENGELYWLPRKVTNYRVKGWNTIFAGKLAGRTKLGIYLDLKYLGKSYLQHRVVWEMHNGVIPPKMQIHHVNSNKHDNRIENLSLVTNEQNQQKSDRAGRGYTFVHDNKHFPYMSTRWIHGKQRRLGHFGTPCGAKMASRMGFVNWQR